MDVIRGFMNWPLQVKIEQSEGLANRAFPRPAVAFLPVFASPSERGGAFSRRD
jgi:hypothetical protein